MKHRTPPNFMIRPRVINLKINLNQIAIVICNFTTPQMVVNNGNYNPPIMMNPYGAQPAMPTVITVQAAAPAQNVGRGQCGACHTGILRTNYSLLAWCICFWCFPCGCLCCLAMSRKKCSHCGVVY